MCLTGANDGYLETRVVRHFILGISSRLLYVSRQGILKGVIHSYGSRDCSRDIKYSSGALQNEVNCSLPAGEMSTATRGHHGNMYTSPETCLRHDLGELLRRCEGIDGGVGLMGNRDGGGSGA